MQLNGEQFEQLEEALLQAYPDQSDLGRMVRITFNQNLQAVAEGADHQERVDKLIEWAESEGKVVDLVRGAHRRNPGNELLRDFWRNHDQDLFKDACKVNCSQLSPDTVLAFIKLPLAAISPTGFVDAGLLALPAGAKDNASDKDFADFTNEKLSSEARFYGFLKLSLEQFPQLKDQPSLLQFTRELRDRLADNVPAKSFLSDWVQQAELEVAPPPRPVPVRPGTQPKRGTLETSLMITVRRCSKQKEGQPLQYQIEGWLFFDQISNLDSPKVLPKPLLCLDLPEAQDQLGIACTWNQLPQRVNHFLDEANRQLGTQIKQELGYRKYQLTLEIFLPVGYMGEAVDQWLRASQAMPLGLDYGVIVRFCDRVDNDELQNRLFDAWDDLQAVLQSPGGETAWHCHIEVPANLEQYSSWQELQLRLKSKLGLKLCCGLPPSEVDKEGLFGAMLYGDIPVAVWTRSPDVVDSDSNPAKSIDLPQALTPYFDMDCFQHPTSLANKLKEVRKQKTCPDKTDERYGRCLGDHIACLLDNPDRLPLPDQLGF